MSLALPFSARSSWEQALNEGIIRAEDNVGAFKSQQIDNLCGTIIRIDPETGLGLSSNPFYDATRPGAPRSKVWALGFRNPYRFIHVPNTGSHNPEDGDPGTLIIGDVGGAAWEEMNIARTGGLNFGWPIFEGVGYHWGFAGAWTANEYMPYEAPNCNSAGYNFQDLIKQLNNIEQEAFKQPCGNPGPVAEDIATFLHTPPAVTWSGLLWNQPPRVAQPGYDSESGNLKEVLMGTQESEVKGTNFAGFTSMPGFFYEDGPFPEEYHGAYFHADLSGWIRVFHFEEDFQLVQVDSFATWDDKGVVHIAYNPSDGALYWCNVYENEVHRISYGGNPRPESIAKADKYYGVGPLTVQFDGTEAFDPDGGSLTYTWDFGDGMSSTLQNPTHTFVAGSNNPQSYTVSLTVTDSLGLSDESSILISLNNTPPKVEITSFENGSTYSIEGVNYLPLEAEVSDVEHELSSLTFEWETFLHHNNHYHPEEPKLAQRSDAILEPLGCLLETYWYRIRLTVTDPEGLSTVDEREIFPYCGEPFVEFVELSARIDDDEIILDWSTEQEQDVAQFIVERTPNFRFLPIGEVAGAGQSMAPQSYSFADTDPQKGGQYYRLKILNSAGDYSYSNIVYIDYSGLRDYTIFPNPSNGLFNLVINEAGGEQVKVEFFNTIGQPMYKLEWETSASQIFREQLDVQQLEPGLYYYRLTHGDKEQSGSVLIVR
ncbi:MAG: PKD domain-containing protein [Bacteroidota bacterium]